MALILCHSSGEYNLKPYFTDIPLLNMEDNLMLQLVTRILRDCLAIQECKNFETQMDFSETLGSTKIANFHYNLQGCLWTGNHDCSMLKEQERSM